MATANTPLPITGINAQQGAGSNELVLREASNELFFAVVGHAGSGTSVVANALRDVLREMYVGTAKIDVEILKAREVIEAWARAAGRSLPRSGGVKTLEDVELLQNYGDDMRAELRNGQQDHAAVARRLVLRIREVRAKKTNAEASAGGAIKPDGRPRAYILDAIRHPAEISLLRHLYDDAFVLIGVFCKTQIRKQRIAAKYGSAKETEIRKFMERDADANEKYGQHVADAFHRSDYFVDNTADRDRDPKRWDVPDKLSRLVKIIAHSEIIRPTSEETAMYHAYSAQMQSACLSRQVGAALVDWEGNVLATGTNEAPRAGGGVYGESFDGNGKDSSPPDFRCAMFPDAADRFCRNTQSQNKIIKELMEEVPELASLSAERKQNLAVELRRTQIGSLLEFSRAVHAEMDALLSAARKGVSLVGTRLFVTAFPCHFCARHIVSAGVDEVQYIEPYPKSQALELHRDAISTELSEEWKPPSRGGETVLFRAFSGVSPRLYERAFLKERELKNKITGVMEIQKPSWGVPWHLSRASYPELEAKLLEGV